MVRAKNLLEQRFGEEVGPLQVRSYVNYLKLPQFYTLTDEMVTDIDVLRVRRSSRVARQVDSAYVVLVD